MQEAKLLPSRCNAHLECHTSRAGCDPAAQGCSRCPHPTQGTAERAQLRALQPCGYGTPVLRLDAAEVLPCAGAAPAQGRGCRPTPLPWGQQGKSCSQQQNHQQPPALGSQPCSGMVGHGDSAVGGAILPFPNEGTDGVSAACNLESEGELQPSMGTAAHSLMEKTHPSSGVQER